MTIQTSFLNNKNTILNNTSGILEYYPNFILKDYFSTLQNEVSWREETISLFGKTLLQPRLISLQGDNEIKYSYSKKEYNASSWTSSLIIIKKIIFKKLNLDFNCCLLNFYRDGKDSMGWHSDNEKELGPEPIIASLSFGATRIFKYKSDSTHSIALESGSLLIMRGQFQNNYKHAIMKCSYSEGRINLTFRNIFKL